MTSYIFENHEEDQEYGRLRIIEHANDPTTISLLEQTGIQADWACLELGGGAGSILKWLGDRVGPTGKVYGIDKNTTYLKKFINPSFSIKEGPFLEVDIEHPLDLVHARYVLIHNKEAKDMMEKVYHLLKPGGFFLVEEPDFTSCTLLNDDSSRAQSRVNSAICSMFHHYGLNPAYGLQLPKNLQTCGFHILQTQSNLHLGEGNSPFAQVMAESALALQEAYCSTGKCTDSDIQQYINNAHTPGFWTIYHSTISVLAQRPQ